MALSRISPSPTVHSVHFYDSDASMVLRLRGIVESALGMGNVALVVATTEHRADLVRELEKAGINVRKAQIDGALAIYDARKALSQFMVDGMPDGDLFFQSVGRIVALAWQEAAHGAHGLTVFGEMVAVLWAEGNRRGALALERLWNELLSQRAFHLHCAYPRALVESDGKGFANICEQHSHLADGNVPDVSIQRSLVPTMHQ